MVQIGTKDYARQQRTEQRQVEAQTMMADQLAAELQRKGELPDRPESQREITGWSRKSRANMVKTLCSLDYAPLFTDRTRLPGMVTLTYPGEWLSVAPDGDTVKRHFNNWRKAFEDAWGEKLACIWKLEFQTRGAPHFHVLMTPPHGVAQRGRFAGLDFRSWLSQSWAAAVGHSDPEQYRRHVLAGTGVDFAEGLRARDPRRVAVYFTKHGSFSAKDYQNVVPEPWQQPGKGPGRFWGVRQLEKAVVTGEMTPADARTLSRTMRRWSRAQGTTREVSRPRVKGGQPQSKYPEVMGLAGAQLVQSRGATRYRRSRSRVERMRDGRGWCSVNDGAAFASQLIRTLGI